MPMRFPGALALVVLALACAGEASALVQRTFVSGLGSDSNPCTRAEPCRTFGAAIVQTQAGGEVVALDSAGYGPVTITQAISLISPPGVYAGITTTTGGINAIEISAGANDVVVLKGLSLTGLDVGAFGVAFNSGKALRVEGLTISGFVLDAIYFAPIATARLTVADSLIRDNGSRAIVASAPSEQLARVTIDRTRMIANSTGLYAGSNSLVDVRDSIVTGSVSSYGFYADPGAVVTMENCIATDNLFAIGSFGLVRVAGTTVSGNVTGLSTAGGGSILSRGNNTVEGNTTEGTFTGSFSAK